MSEKRGAYGLWSSSCVNERGNHGVVSSQVFGQEKITRLVEVLPQVVKSLPDAEKPQDRVVSIEPPEGVGGRKQRSN